MTNEHAAPAPAGGEIDALIAEANKAIQDGFDTNHRTLRKLVAALAALQERVSEQNEIIALAATDYLRTKDKWAAEPLLREKFPRMLAELTETGEWMREYVRDRNGAMAKLADRMKELEEALEFYADRNGDGYRVDATNYGLSVECGAIVEDAGMIARAALRSDG